MIVFRTVTIKFTKFNFKHPGMGRFPLLLLLGVHILYIQLFYNYMHQANPSYTGVIMFFAITLAMVAFLISIFSYSGAPSRRILSRIINTMVIATFFGLLEILLLPDIDNCDGGSSWGFSRCFQIGYKGLTIIDYVFPLIFLAFWITLPILMIKERKINAMEIEFNMKKSKI